MYENEDTGHEEVKAVVKPFGQFEITFKLNGYGEDLEKNIQVIQELGRRLANSIEMNPTFEPYLELVEQPEIKHLLAGGYDI